MSACPTIFSALLFIGSHFLYGQEPKLSLKGTYQGQNIYVQNPFHENGQFCTTRVLVNGKPTLDSIHASAYEINLSVYGFMINDTVSIEIFHYPDCSPKVLYPMHPARAPIQFKDIYIDSTETLHWNVNQTMGKAYFTIQSYQWNKWITIADLELDSVKAHQDISHKLNSHSGLNKIRLAYFSDISSPLEWTSNRKEVGFAQAKNNEIRFTQATRYELFDADGNMVNKGYSNTINIHHLRPGAYYLNFDNFTREFTIAKKRNPRP